MNFVQLRSGRTSAAASFTGRTSAGGSPRLSHTSSMRSMPTRAPSRSRLPPQGDVEMRGGVAVPANAAANHPVEPIATDGATSVQSAAEVAAAHPASAAQVDTVMILLPDGVDSPTSSTAAGSPRAPESGSRAPVPAQSRSQRSLVELQSMNSGHMSMQPLHPEAAVRNYGSRNAFGPENASHVPLPVWLEQTALTQQQPLRNSTT